MVRQITINGLYTVAATVKPYMRPEDYSHPMVWCKLHSRLRGDSRKLVLPASLLSGAPITHNRVTYQIQE